MRERRWWRRWFVVAAIGLTVAVLEPVLAIPAGAAADPTVSRSEMRARSGAGSPFVVKRHGRRVKHRKHGAKGSVKRHSREDCRSLSMAEPGRSDSFAEW